MRRRNLLLATMASASCAVGEVAVGEVAVGEVVVIRNMSGINVGFHEPEKAARREEPTVAQQSPRRYNTTRETARRAKRIKDHGRA